MKVYEIVDFLHSLAPPEFQESYDNSGLLVGDPDDEVRSVLVSLDLTEEVLEEALILGANLVISHHPVIFTGLKRLVGSNYVQRIVRQAIKNDINLMAIHTNLDNVFENGVNKNIADKLGLREQRILRPKSDFSQDGTVGSGMIGHLETEIDEKEFLVDLKSKMQATCIKHTRMLGRKIQTVALCGGSGRFLLEDAISAGADVFISSDFKYHDYFEADGKILIADIGHYESEQFTTNMLHRILTNKFNTFATHYTKVDTNPVNYL